VEKEFFCFTFDLVNQIQEHSAHTQGPTIC